jgi:hypothetical protein
MRQMFLNCLILPGYTNQPTVARSCTFTAECPGMCEAVSPHVYHDCACDWVIFLFPASRPTQLSLKLYLYHSLHLMQCLPPLPPSLKICSVKYTKHASHILSSIWRKQQKPEISHTIKHWLTQRRNFYISWRKSCPRHIYYWFTIC